MPLLNSALITFCAYAIGVYSSWFTVSPDGQHYLASGRKEIVPSPFHRRWLVPLLCGESVTLWGLVTGLSLILTGPVLFVYLQGWGIDDAHALFGVALFAGLPMFRSSVFFLVLTDAPAFLWALAAAAAAPYDIRLAVLLATVAASMKESAAIFAAAAALNPWLLLGCVGALPSLLIEHSPAELEPFSAGREAHAKHILNPYHMLFPWGAGILALFNPGWLLLGLIPAYGQLILATDTVRLYQWAAPGVIALAAPVLPVEWLLPVAVLHIFTPFASKTPL